MIPATHRTVSIGAVAFVTAMTIIAGLNLAATPVSAATDSANVSFSVGALVSITVEPDAYRFTNVDIGETNFSTGHRALRLVVRNNGSTNISDIYAHPNTLNAEQDNPLPTGSAAEHASAKFLWISNRSDGGPFHHVGVLMWNITEAAGGEPFGVEDVSSAVAHGYYRNTTGNYLWSLAADQQTGTCSASGAQFTIKTSPDTGVNRDLRPTANNTTTHVPTANNEEWAMMKADRGPLAGHYIALHTSCEKVYAFRYDNDPQFPLRGNDDQFLLGPANTTVLEPGQKFVGRVGVAVPPGTPSGTTNATTLTIHATGVQ